MSVNTDVKYEQLPGKIKSLQTAGQNLQKKFQEAYDGAKEMNKAWDGKRYTEVAKAFNNMIPNINKLVKLLVTDVPDNLGTVAKNFAKFNGTSVSYISQSAKTIAQIPNGNATGMKFVESNVSSCKTKINNAFSSAEKILNSDAQSAVNGILGVWSGNDANSFKNSFSTLKNNIVTQIQEIKKAVDSNIAAAISDAKSVESSNTFK